MVFYGRGRREYPKLPPKPMYENPFLGHYGESPTILCERANEGKRRFFIRGVGAGGPRPTLAWGESARGMLVNHARWTRCVRDSCPVFFENNRNFF